MEKIKLEMTYEKNGYFELSYKEKDLPEESVFKVKITPQVLNNWVSITGMATKFIADLLKKILDYLVS